LLALEAQQNANAENIQLARLKNKPKFTVGLEHTFIGDEPMAGETSGDDATALVFGMTLPIYGARNTSRVEQAKAMLSSVRQKHIARSQELQSQWAQAVFAMDEAARRLRLHQNELIPREQQILATLEESYRTTGDSWLLKLLLPALPPMRLLRPPKLKTSLASRCSNSHAQTHLLLYFPSSRHWHPSGSALARPPKCRES
jgi:hypothetical protein